MRVKTVIYNEKEETGVFQRKRGSWYYRLKRVDELGCPHYYQQSGFSTKEEALRAKNLFLEHLIPNKTKYPRNSIIFDDLFKDFISKGVKSEHSKKKYEALYSGKLKEFKKRIFVDIPDKEFVEYLSNLDANGYSKSYISSLKKLINLLTSWYIKLVTPTNKPSDDLVITGILSGKPITKDYIKLDKVKKEVGLIGELYVIKYLKDRGITGIHHTSRIDGDGFGYDIEVHNDIIDFYIEVKSTKGSADSAFFITSNEKRILSQLGDKGNIYRVYNLKYDKSKLSLLNTDREDEFIETIVGEIIFTSLSEIENELEPVCYKCSIS